METRLVSREALRTSSSSTAATATAPLILVDVHNRSVDVVSHLIEAEDVSHVRHPRRLEIGAVATASVSSMCFCPFVARNAN